MTHPCQWKLTVTSESSHYNLKRHDYRRLLESEGITYGMIIAIKDNNEPKKNYRKTRENRTNATFKLHNSEKQSIFAGDMKFERVINGKDHLWAVRDLTKPKNELAMLFD